MSMPVSSPGVSRRTSLPRTAVVICAYTEKRWSDLKRAVDSVARQSHPPHEIVVVVDHNSRLLARVREKLRDVVAVTNVEERGLSGARNSGLRTATGDIIAFLDDDAVAAPDWIETIAGRYDDHDVVGVGGAVLPHWLAGRPAAFPAEFDWVVGCTYEGMPTEATEVRNFIGANMSFRREVFSEIGGFSFGIGRVGTRPVGCEETEFCIRARRRWPDARILYEPRAVVHHTVPAERGGWRYFVARCYAEGLSKAVVAQLWGAGDGLASERAYTFRTLPRGVIRGLGDAARGDLAGAARSGAIVTGLSCTTVGYVAGLLRSPRRRKSQDGAVHA
jgi:glycosyltransferase involved in cell wall biosynthesis